MQLLKVQLLASHTTPPRGPANLSAASQATASPPFLDPRTEGVLKLLSAHAIPLLPYLKGAHRHQCQPTAGLNLRSLSPHRTPMLRHPCPPPPTHLTHHLVPASSTPRGRSHFHRPPQRKQPPAYKQVLTSALLIPGLDTCFCVYLGGLPCARYNVWPVTTPHYRQPKAPVPQELCSSGFPVYVQTEVQTLCHHLQDLSPA